MFGHDVCDHESRGIARGGDGGLVRGKVIKNYGRCEEGGGESEGDAEN